MRTQRYQPPSPSFERENSKCNIAPPLGTKCPLVILFGSYKHNCMQRDLFTYRWKDSLQNSFLLQGIMQNISLLSFFSNKNVVV